MRLLFGFVHIGGTPLVLSQLSITDDLNGCGSFWVETAVVSVQARVLLPDPPHAAPGDGWVAAISLVPKPPADVLSVGAVAQAAGLAWPCRGRQGVPVQEGGFECRAAQHQQFEERRGGDAGAVAPPAAQLLVGDHGGDAAGTLAPGGRSGLWVGFVVGRTV